MTYGTLGLEMGISLVIGLGIGYYLDRYFGTSPVLLIIFMIFGIVAGMKRLYTLWKRMEREDERHVDK
jgi:ATP synthase protein I